MTDQTERRLDLLTIQLSEIKNKVWEIGQQTQRHELMMRAMLALFHDLTVVVQDEEQDDGRTSAPSGLVS
jgi:hypothetical protein